MSDNSILNNLQMPKQMNWTLIYVGIITVILLILAYFSYRYFTKGKPEFKANRENVNEDDKKDSVELLMFHVDWCPHCKSAKPEWDKLKNEFENKTINGYKILFIEYNCTNETPEIEEMIKKYNIEGYPTIKLIKDDQVIDYDAKPTKSTMEQFLNTVL